MLFLLIFCNIVVLISYDLFIILMFIFAWPVIDYSMFYIQMSFKFQALLTIMK